jgi:hypothetical protein
MLNKLKARISANTIMNSNLNEVSSILQAIIQIKANIKKKNGAYKRGKKYITRIRLSNNQRVHVGSYSSRKEAIQVYLKVAKMRLKTLEGKLRDTLEKI